MIRVHIPTLTAERVPLPDFLAGLAPESLANLAWTDRELGVQDYAWWPSLDETPSFDADTHQRGAETLTADMDAKVVRVIADIVPRTAEEVQATMTAIGNELSSRVDTQIAAIYAGPQRFIKEYEEREQQARDFIASGGIGEVPPRIAAFASASGMDAMSAAQLTVQQADNLRGALGQLADLRMRKYEIKRAMNRAAKQATFDDIQAKAEAIAKAIG